MVSKQLLLENFGGKIVLIQARETEYSEKAGMARLDLDGFLSSQKAKLTEEKSRLSR